METTAKASETGQYDYQGIFLEIQTRAKKNCKCLTYIFVEEAGDQDVVVFFFRPEVIL